ncbi:MAG: hypothetical protein Q7V63_02710 [Gammaproteobacteria bacterium]|nr:hypothetical protein [Gammaproteobacteria bacterium]
MLSVIKSESSEMLAIVQSYGALPEYSSFSPAGIISSLVGSKSTNQDVIRPFIAEVISSPKATPFQYADLLAAVLVKIADSIEQSKDSEQIKKLSNIRAWKEIELSIIKFQLEFNDAKLTKERLFAAFSEMLIAIDSIKSHISSGSRLNTTLEQIQVKIEAIYIGFAALFSVKKAHSRFMPATSPAVRGYKHTFFNLKADAASVPLPRSAPVPSIAGAGVGPMVSNAPSAAVKKDIRGMDINFENALIVLNIKEAELNAAIKSDLKNDETSAETMIKKAFLKMARVHRADGLDEKDTDSFTKITQLKELLEAKVVTVKSKSEAQPDVRADFHASLLDDIGINKTDLEARFALLCESALRLEQAELRLNELLTRLSLPSSDLRVSDLLKIRADIVMFEEMVKEAISSYRNLDEYIGDRIEWRVLSRDQCKLDPDVEAATINYRLLVDKIKPLIRHIARKCDESKERAEALSEQICDLKSGLDQVKFLPDIVVPSTPVMLEAELSSAKVAPSRSVVEKVDLNSATCCFCWFGPKKPAQAAIAASPAPK